MTNKPILVSTPTSGITTLTLNRPDKRNAMDAQMIKELLNALQKLADDHETRVLMIMGQGEHFCAGADIAWMLKIAECSYEENVADAQMLAYLMYQLYSFPKPTIVLAHGVTVGGGLGLVAAGDIALAAKSASFSFAEVKLGIAPSVISPYVISAIGQRAAHYYFLTGDRFGAEEAHRLGLIHQFVENEALMSVGMSLAETIVKNSPNALIAAKQLIRRVNNEKVTENLVRTTAENLATLRASPQAREGLQAFLQKRTPQWR